MGNYSKLIASLVGAAAGILVSYNLLPAELATTEIQASVVVVITGLVTYFAPANRAA
ncbi:hypothetical protein [Roseibium sp.]|uniref:hypothetical protein n=1 Tax=Roseibium sp. TaxID=1936156 RepID=UPI00327C35CE